MTGISSQAGANGTSVANANNNKVSSASMKKQKQKQKQSPSAKFRFKKHDNIGVSDAEQDQNYLHDCFVDTGEINVLLEIENPRRILVGRTGSGKTALLMQLENRHPSNVIDVKPESLALNYISNSNILNFVLELGVSLDIFFRLLWRHVFVVEILKHIFKIENEEDSLSFIERIKLMFRDKKYDRALEYLREWGKSFWEDTDYRIKEVTSRVESDLKASFGADLPPARINLEGAKKVSAEEKGEIVHRAQEVINKVQIKELSEIIDLLGDVLEMKDTDYYIVIDRLDENWTTETLRYILIRALIETVRDFKKARRVKIIVALRYDLIDRVFRYTQDSGFQEEKYEGLYLNVGWNKKQLTEILDRRINHLVRSRYTGQKLTNDDLLPKTILKMPTIDYLLDRTLKRPRDIIEFFNFCILQAADTPKITSQMIKEAEGEYSRTRLRSIGQEWSADYPNLLTFIELLKNRKAHFPLYDLTNDECADFALNLLIGGVEKRDDLLQVTEKFVNVEVDAAHFRSRVFQIFYRVGFVGLKIESYQQTAWTTDGRRNIAVSEIKDDTRVSIHPCFYRIFGVNVKALE
jgi:hypothetical protein